MKSVLPQKYKDLHRVEENCQFMKAKILLSQTLQDDKEIVQYLIIGKSNKGIYKCHKILNIQEMNLLDLEHLKKERKKGEAKPNQVF